MLCHCVFVYTWLACDILLDLLWRLAGSPSLILSMLQPHASMVFRDSLTGQPYASLSCKIMIKFQTKTDSESDPYNKKYYLYHCNKPCNTMTNKLELHLTGYENFCDFLYRLKSAGTLSDWTAVFSSLQLRLSSSRTSLLS